MYVYNSALDGRWSSGRDHDRNEYTPSPKPDWHTPDFNPAAPCLAGTTRIQ
jgi:hypothetical protein